MHFLRESFSRVINSITSHSQSATSSNELITLAIVLFSFQELWHILLTIASFLFMDSGFTKFKYLSISWENSVRIISLVCLGWCLFHNVGFLQMFDNSVISIPVRDEGPGLSFTVEAGVHFLNSSGKCLLSWQWKPVLVIKVQILLFWWERPQIKPPILGGVC